MKNLIILAVLFLSITTFAQDKIVKKNGDIIKCTVTEMAADEVKYFYETNPKVVFGLDNALIARVEFGTGEVVEIESNSFNNEEYYAGQNKHALKINFLSPLMGSTELVYEQSMKAGNSWETAIGIVGLGIDQGDINPIGFYGKFAYKFIRTPDFYIQRMHYSHILKGAYFAPEIAMRYVKFDSYQYDYYSSTESTTRKDEFAFAFTLKFGKQWVFNDSFLVDFYTGIGYGYAENKYNTLPYGFVSGTEDFPIAITGGLRIGWVF